MPCRNSLPPFLINRHRPTLLPPHPTTPHYAYLRHRHWCFAWPSVILWCIVPHGFSKRWNQLRCCKTNASQQQRKSNHWFSIHNTFQMSFTAHKKFCHRGRTNRGKHQELAQMQTRHDGGERWRLLLGGFKKKKRATKKKYKWAKRSVGQDHGWRTIRERNAGRATRTNSIGALLNKCGTGKQWPRFCCCNHIKCPPTFVHCLCGSVGVVLCGISTEHHEAKLQRCFFALPYVEVVVVVLVEVLTVRGFHSFLLIKWELVLPTPSSLTPCQGISTARARRWPDRK